MSSECVDNNVYVGRKFFMRYVLSVLMMFTLFRCKDVVIRARGSNISKAVLVAESCRYLIDAKYTSIDIGSAYIDLGGRRRILTTIKIVLSAPSKSGE